MANPIIILLLFLLIAGASPVCAAVTVAEKDQGEIVLENNSLRLTIDSRSGGQIVGLVDKRNQRELTPRPQGASVSRVGLFSDHDTTQTYPGECMQTNYEYRLVAEPAENPGVMLEYRFKKWLGTFESNLGDFILQKTIRLEGDLPVVRVRVQFKNIGKGEKSLVDAIPYVNYWVQNIVQISNDKGKDIYLRPGTRGIQELKNGPGAAADEFLHTPTDGWTAALDPETAEGLVFLVDYNRLKTLYNCVSAGTMEWMYMGRPLKPGETWETEIVCVVAQGFKGLSHASHSVLAHVETKLDGNRLKIVHRLATAILPVKNVSVETILVHQEEGKEEPLPRYEVAALETVPIVRESEVELKTPGLKIIKTRVKTQDATDEFETPVVYQKSELTYQKIPPRKEGTVVSPAGCRVKRTGKVLDVLVLREPKFGDLWNILPALQSAVGEAKGKDGWILYGMNYYYYFPKPEKFDYFPPTLQDLCKYNAVILENGDFSPLAPEQRDTVRAYVEAGGVLLVLGGYYAFGKAEVDAVYNDLLPVACSGAWDLKKAANPAIIVKKDGAVTAGCAWKQPVPECYWYHRVSAKDKAEVILEIDGYPLLICWGVGKGKVAAFTGTVCLSEEGRAENPFWKWKDYNVFIGNLVQNLVAAQEE